MQLDDVRVNVWNIATLATPDEKEQLCEAVRMLETSEGRSSLIVKYGARMETSGDGVTECTNAEASSETVDVQIDDCTSSRFAIGAAVRLHGLREASRNDAMGVVQGFDVARKRYIVRLDAGGTFSVSPCNVLNVTNVTVTLRGPTIGKVISQCASVAGIILSRHIEC